MVEALREGRNNVEVIGTVKKVEIQEKDSKTGRPMIIGSVTLEVKEKNKVSNIRCKLFSFKLKNDGKENGLYKGYKTVMDTYKEGDRVQVAGALTINEYYNQSGSLVSFNEVKAVFFNRLEGEEANKADKAVATVDLVIEGMTSKIDAENIPTGELEVDAFAVGYNSSIIPIQKLIIAPELAETFQNMYVPGSTGRITMRINNYAELEEVEVKQDQQAGFGSAERVESDVVTNYVNNLEIIGGDLPYMDGVNEYSPNDIEQAHKNRQLTLQQLKEGATPPSTPPTGFGNATTTNTATPQATEADEDIPPF